ncbi:MAG: hypothetical protein Tsb002_03160 [Wenzhouxiangellaceae bacterium]
MVLNGLIVLCLAALWWHQASLRRDRVLKLLRRWCKSQQLVLLDDTVIWRGWQRQSGQWLRWSPRYVFEVTTDGLSRLGGWLWLETQAPRRAWVSIDHPQADEQPGQRLVESIGPTDGA